MVTTDVEWLDQVATLSIQLLVAVLGFKLDVLHDEWLFFADMLEAVFVDVLSSIVNTGSALTLVAIGEDGLEFLECEHRALSFEVSHF